MLGVDILSQDRMALRMPTSGWLFVSRHGSYLSFESSLHDHKRHHSHK